MKILIGPRDNPPKKDKLCPKCGVDRSTVRLMLQDMKGSDNWEYANKIIINCPDCKRYFGEEKDEQRII